MLAGLCILHSGAMAQDAETQSPQPVAKATTFSDTTVSFSTSIHHSLSADFSDTPGSVDVTRFQASADIDTKIAEGTWFGVQIGTELSWYGFDDATGFASNGEPWDETMEVQLNALVRHRVGDRWMLLAGGGADSSMQIGADFGDSITYGGIVGATYGCSETLSIGGAVMVLTRLEDDVSIIPIPIIRWQFAERWSLTTGTKYGRFAGATLGYKATESISLALEAGYAVRAYRLDSDAPTPDGIGRDSRIPVRFRVTYSPDSQVELDAFAGMDAWQQFTLDDEDGDEVMQDEADAAFVFGIGATIKF